MPYSLQSFNDDMLLFLFTYLGFQGMLSLGKVSHFFRKKIGTHFARYIVNGFYTTARNNRRLYDATFPITFCGVVPRFNYNNPSDDILMLIHRQLERIKRDTRALQIVNYKFNRERKNYRQIRTNDFALQWDVVCPKGLFNAILTEIRS